MSSVAVVKSYAKEAGLLLGLTAIVWISVLMARQTTGFSPMWPINGMLLGLCCLSTKREALRVLLVGVGANIMGSYLAGETHVMVWGLAAINLVEIAIAWLPIRAQARKVKNLGDPSILARFTIFGLVVGPGISGLLLMGMLYWQHGWADGLQWLTWWSGNALGMAVFAPLVVALRQDAWADLYQAFSQRQCLLRLVVLLGVVGLVFFWKPAGFSYLVFAPMMWLVFGLGFAGAPIGTLAVAAIAFPALTWGFGPLSLTQDDPLAHRMVLLQIYLASFLLVTMPVGMVLDHRKRLLAKLQDQKNKLEHLSTHDPLTNLLNRRGMDAYLEEHQDLGAIVALVDVDHFKSYNDTYGHNQGDECLVAVAQALVAQFPEGQVGRYGGEEFVVVVPAAHAAPEDVGERMRNAIGDLNREHTGSPFGHLTISGGLTCVPRMGDLLNSGEVWTMIDQALYRAKSQGRNTVVMA